jgi:hypothetical protein
LLREWKFDQVAEAFSFAGERQENLAVEETAVLLKRFSRSPEVEKAKVEFDRAQKVEERFHKEFDGIDFTIYFSGVSPTSPIRLRSPT